MNTRRNWLKATLAASLAAAVVVPLAAFGKPGHGDHRKGGFEIGRMLERHAERLDLDEATVARIQEVVEAQRAKTKTLREASKREREVMRELLSQASPNESAVLQQAEVVGQLRTERHKQHLSAWLQVRSMLTPAQLEELKQIRKENRAERRERFQERRSERRQRAQEQAE